MPDDIRAKYEAVIGLEIHAELDTASKMFCGSDNVSPLDTPANLHICEVCAGEPGTLPVLNKQAIDWTIKTGLALNMKIAELTKWDRKQYFYPDLPKGYQISQYEQPLTYKGKLSILDDEGNEKEIEVTRIHLEEDTGKLSHPSGKPYSLVDYNRAGTPLMELVTEPDIKTSGEAKRFAVEYQRILRTIGASNANMEKGEMRVEANISVKPVEQSEFGTKVEVKNLNSFKAVERAIEHEIKRQIELIEEGGTVTQETRGWNESKGKTFPQRVKESANDYRYFPEPDLPEVVVDKKWLDEIRKTLDAPSLPAMRRKGLMAMGLSMSEADALIDSPKLAELFEDTVSEVGVENAKKISGLILTELIGHAKAQKLEPEEYKFTTEQFIEFARAVVTKEFSSAIAKAVLPDLYKGTDYQKVLETKDLKMTSDAGAITAAVEQAIAENPEVVSEYKSGKVTAIEFLVGKVMAATRGQADPGTVRDLLLAKLATNSK